MELTEDGVLLVAASPGALLEDALPDLRRAYAARSAIVQETAEGDLDAIIERLTTRSSRVSESLDCANSRSTDARDLATQPQVVRYVNLLLRDAVEQGASDIHLESAKTGLTARFRIDGVLTRTLEAPAQLQHAVISRIKLLAELDIAERRRPQDGRIRARLERGEIDLRVSVVPTLYGESVVLRLLDRGDRPVQLADLGMPSDILESVERLAMRPHGLMLVTGPTGSGKTTTLYSALRMRDAEAEKIVTVEDPIEYQLPGITQVIVSDQAGISFAAALRSILRQDPDVLMVGEMRDSETASIAVRAALTGHVVYSTLHTNNALGAMPRMVDLGVPAYLVAATVEAVLAQRLVRRICPKCCETYQPTAEQMRALGGLAIGVRQLVRGRGCEQCRKTGYKGRVGIFELLLVDEAVKDAINRQLLGSELAGICEGALRPLAGDASAKLEAGLTTAEEVLRVAHA